MSLSNAELLAPPSIPKRRRRSMLTHVRELFSHRDLVFNLTLRELKARYKNSVFGFFWSLLNPLGMMLVFTVVFTVMVPNTQVENFPIFLLCGLLPWNFFSAGTMTATNSMVTNGNLVKKVYFPREALPLASVLASLVNFLLALLVLFAALLILRVRLSPYMLLLPVVILVQTCFVTGISLILSALNVFYRDVQIIMEVVMLAWFFLTPVFYPIDILPQSYAVFGLDLDVRRLTYILNPMASLISAYRDLLYWGYRTDPDFLLRTALTAVSVLAFGYWFFLRYSHRFGEEV